jgi:hypothetical protein
MKLFINFLCIFIVGFTQPNVTIGVNMTQLITTPKVIKTNTEFEVILITGLSHDKVTWHSKDTIYTTPESLIMIITKKGEYIPYIRNGAQPNYKIIVE